MTEAGLAQATAIYERHTILTKMFMMLGVSENTATQDACLIEHVISEETFLAIKNHFMNQSEE